MEAPETAQRPPPDDEGFSEPNVPKPTPVAEVDTAPAPKTETVKLKVKAAKPPKPPRVLPKEDDEEGDEDPKPKSKEAADDGKPKPGERGHPQTGDAEPLAPTPIPTAEEMGELFKAQRAKKRGIRLKRALKEFPEIQELIDENEALKARLAELT